MATLQEQYLKTLGIQPWQQRHAPAQSACLVTELMIINEAPSPEEGQQNLSTVTSTSQLLADMIKVLGYSSEQVNFASATEVSACTPPARLLLVFGEIAAQHLLQTQASLESLRGTPHEYGENNTPLIVTYHPAYLLRHPIDKKKAYQDLLLTKRTLGL